MASKKIESDLRALPDLCAEHYSTGNFARGIEEIMRITRSVNNLFQETKPWSIVKLRTEAQRLEWIQFVTLESLRIMSILLQPIVPIAMTQSLDRLGIPERERTWNHSKYDREKSMATPLGIDTGPLFRRV